MQPEQQAVSLPLKAFYFGGGSVAILILEIAALAYGVSDGSLIFVAPLLISPILGVIGVVLGVLTLKRRLLPRRWAILGIIFGSLCVLLFIGIVIFAIALASALQGVF